MSSVFLRSTVCIIFMLHIFVASATNTALIDEVVFPGHSNSKTPIFLDIDLRKSNDQFKYVKINNVETYVAGYGYGFASLTKFGFPNIVIWGIKPGGSTDEYASKFVITDGSVVDVHLFNGKLVCRKLVGHKWVEIISSDVPDVAGTCDVAREFDVSEVDKLPNDVYTPGDIRGLCASSSSVLSSESLVDVASTGSCSIVDFVSDSDKDLAISHFDLLKKVTKLEDELRSLKYEYEYLRNRLEKVDKGVVEVVDKFDIV